MSNQDHSLKQTFFFFFIFCHRRSRHFLEENKKKRLDGKVRAVLEKEVFFSSLERVFLEGSFQRDGGGQRQKRIAEL
ncbi:hypothetical protein CEXT_358101 [Caerostris extrusa]|uniref:Uncharacterized protein n=1 Tax=Caerostris extrusa TaxID=172846 RepID=A0AAV4XPK8_CAEEX|nr:hypothetical protein CEXT_358101 [Caerostris extrusa]